MPAIALASRTGDKMTDDGIARIAEIEAYDNAVRDALRVLGVDPVCV